MCDYETTEIQRYVNFCASAVKMTAVNLCAVTSSASAVTLDRCDVMRRPQSHVFDVTRSAIGVTSPVSADCIKLL